MNQDFSAETGSTIVEETAISEAQRIDWDLDVGYRQDSISCTPDELRRRDVNATCAAW